MLHRLALLAALAALAAFAGCAPLDLPSSEANLRNERVLMPTLRVAIPLGTEGERGPEPRSGAAFELSGAYARGSATQTLSGGSPILLGGAAFNPPASVGYEFGLTHLQGAWRARGFFGESRTFGGELLFGFGFDQLSLDATSGALRASEDISRGGLVLGVGALWRPRPGTSLQARWTLFEGTSDFEDTHPSQRIELAAVQALGQNMALRAGWSWWQYRTGRGRERSAIDLRVSGPALGLDLLF